MDCCFCIAVSFNANVAIILKTDKRLRIFFIEREGYGTADTDCVLTVCGNDGGVNTEVQAIPLRIVDERVRPCAYLMIVDRTCFSR